MRKPFPHFIGNDAENNKLNPIYEFYKRIERLDMREFNLKLQVSYLTEAKDLEIIVNEVLLTPQNTEELETITNPEFYMKGINAMNFTFKKPLDLTNEFFNNISLIKPRLLILNFFKDSIKNSDFIKILANIKHCDNLKLSKQSFLKTGFKLSFKNISILVKSNVLRPIYIECKNFTWELNANRLNEWIISYQRIKFNISTA